MGTFANILFFVRVGNPDEGFINIENMSIMNDVRDHLMALVERNYELKRTDGLYDIMASFQSEGFDANNLDKVRQYKMPLTRF